MLVYVEPSQTYAACCLLGLQPATLSETLLKQPLCLHVVTFALGLEADQNATWSLRCQPQVCAKACVAVMPILAWKGAFENAFSRTNTGAANSQPPLLLMPSPPLGAVADSSALLKTLAAVPDRPQTTGGDISLEIVAVRPGICMLLLMMMLHVLKMLISWWCAGITAHVDTSGWGWRWRCCDEAGCSSFLSRVVLYPGESWVRNAPKRKPGLSYPRNGSVYHKQDMKLEESWVCSFCSRNRSCYRCILTFLSICLPSSFYFSHLSFTPSRSSNSWFPARLWCKVCRPVGQMQSACGVPNDQKRCGHFRANILCPNEGERYWYDLKRM